MPVPIRPLTPDALEQLILDESVLQILDVRTPEEYLYLGHLGNALLIPLQVLPRFVDRLNPAQPVVVVCQHGVRSLQASDFLIQQGFETVYNLTDGMAAWTGSLEYG